MSDRSLNKDEGISLDPLYGPMGPMGIASSDAAAYVAWPDSRAGRPLVPLQDTYVAMVMHEAQGETSTAGVKATSVALGAGGALALAGLAASLITSRLRRSRQGVSGG